MQKTAEIHTTPPLAVLTEMQQKQYFQFPKRTAVS